MTVASHATRSRKPVRCLVIQLAKLGDTLQSLMALRAAKQLYPELEIHFVVRERFAAAARRVPWLSEVISLPTDDLLGPVLASRHGEEDLLADIARWIGPMVREPWDLLFNWSFSDSSSYLAGLLPARVKLGFARKPDSSFSCPDGWSQYVQAVVQQGIPQNIHLTDILTTQLLTALQIHVGDPEDAGNAPVTSKGFFALERRHENLGPAWKDQTRKWIGIQLGAGTPSKAWDPENWAEVAALILNRHPEASIVLLGGREDDARARRFMTRIRELAQIQNRVVSAVGRSEFDLWANVIGRCQWLLAGDTAALHLASILGTRVLNVSLGGVRLDETGPYGTGHYVVSAEQPCSACDRSAAPDTEHSCHRSVTPEAIYGTWAYASCEWHHRRQMDLHGHFGRLGWEAQLGKCRVFRSRIRSTQDGGGVVFEPLLKRPLDLTDWTAQAVGHVARAWYCGWVPPVAQELDRATISPKLIQELRALEEACGLTQKICDEARAASVSLQNRAERLRSERIMSLKERQEIGELSQKILELDSLVERMGTTTIGLRAFSNMSKVLMHNLRGEQLVETAREGGAAYQQLNQGLVILRDWVKSTLALARPVSLRPAQVISIEASPT